MWGQESDHQKRNFAVADESSASSKLTHEEKFGSASEQSTTDSGFVSGDIQRSDSTYSSGPIEDRVEEEDEKGSTAPMHLDSGIVGGSLVGNFSSLSLAAVDPLLNDLSCRPKQQQQPLTPAVSNAATALVDQHIAHARKLPARDFSWEEYFRQNEDGNTPLHLAIVENRLDIVIFLIHAAPSSSFLDTLNDASEAPIHLAVGMQKPDIVRFLVVAGAKLSPRNLDGDSPLHLAARNGDLMCCHAITDPIQNQERENINVTYSQQPQQRINLNQWNYDGQTCVHVAAINRHTDVLKHLVRSGADINARAGCDGYTALHYSIEQGDETLMNYLLTDCTPLNAKTVTYGGKTVLDISSKIPPSYSKILKDIGVEETLYSSDEEFDSDDSDDDTKTTMYDNNTTRLMSQNLVNASA